MQDFPERPETERTPTGIPDERARWAFSQSGKRSTISAESRPRSGASPVSFLHFQRLESGLLVRFTREEYERFWRGVDREVCELMAAPLKNECKCEAACKCEGA